MNHYRSRRNFIKQSSLLTAGAFVKPEALFKHDSSGVSSIPVPDLQKGKVPAAPLIMTVNGAITDPGFSLVHEHILVDFIGADKASPSRYNSTEVFNTALPKLRELTAKGCKTFVDCTPAYLGRDAALLKRLSSASGLNIVTNTGYYGAAKEKYLPPQAYTESAEQVANRWIREYEKGMDGTSVKPGFIKCAVDSFPLSAVQAKMIEAAAITHLATGLTIYVHTGNGAAAKEEMRIITSRKVSPSAWVWVHAQGEQNRNFHYEIAKAGGWVSFDSISSTSIDACLKFLRDMQSEKLLHRVLLSQDSGWYNVGEPGGGKFNDYNTILDKFIPAMGQAGFTQSEIDLLFKQNPLKALSVSVRKI